MVKKVKLLFLFLAIAVTTNAQKRTNALVNASMLFNEAKTDGLGF